MPRRKNTGQQYFPGLGPKFAVSKTSPDPETHKYTWERVSDLYLPAIFRKKTKYLSVRMVELKLLSRFSNVLPNELQQTLPKCTSYLITERESALLDFINLKICDAEYGHENFSTQDAIVLLSEFVEFYDMLEDTMMPKISADIGLKSGGWLQINNTVCPYLWSDGIKHVPYELVSVAAGLRNSVCDRAKKPISSTQLTVLNKLCDVAKRTFSFEDGCFMISLVVVKQQFRPLVLELPPDKPFECAHFVDPAYTEENIEELRVTARELMNTFYNRRIVQRCSAKAGGNTGAQADAVSEDSANPLTSKPSSNRCAQNQPMSLISDTAVSISSRAASLEVEANATAELSVPPVSSISRSAMPFESTGGEAERPNRQSCPIKPSTGVDSGSKASSEDQKCSNGAKSTKQSGDVAVADRKQKEVSDKANKRKKKCDQNGNSATATNVPEQNITGVCTVVDDGTLKEVTSPNVRHKRRKKSHGVTEIVSNDNSKQQVNDGAVANPSASDEACHNKETSSGENILKAAVPNTDHSEWKYPSSDGNPMEKTSLMHSQQSSKNLMMAPSTCKLSARYPMTFITDGWPTVLLTTASVRDKIAERYPEMLALMAALPVGSPLDMIGFELLTHFVRMSSIVKFIFRAAMDYIDDHLKQSEHTLPQEYRLFGHEASSVAHDAFTSFEFWNASVHRVTIGAAEIVNNAVVQACLGQGKYSYCTDPDIVHFIVSGVFGARTFTAAANFRFLQDVMSLAFIAQGHTTLSPLDALTRVSVSYHSYYIVVRNWVIKAEGRMNPNLSHGEFTQLTYQLFNEVYTSGSACTDLPVTSLGSSTIKPLPPYPAMPVPSTSTMLTTHSATVSTSAKSSICSVTTDSGVKTTPCPPITQLYADGVAPDRTKPQSTQPVTAPIQPSSKPQVCPVPPRPIKPPSASTLVVLTRQHGRRLPVYRLGDEEWLLVEDVQKAYFPKMTITNFLKCYQNLEGVSLPPLTKAVDVAFRKHYQMAESELFDVPLMISSKSLDVLIECTKT